MCDNVLSSNILPQQTADNLEFIPNAVSIPYIGPTFPTQVILTNKPDAKTILSQGASFEVLGPICDRTTFLEGKGKLTIQKIISGAYQTRGGEIEFKSLYFNFSNLILELSFKYYFNPSTICKSSEGQKDDLSFLVSVDKISFDKEKYFVSNTPDPDNVNKLFYDLISLLSDPQSSFIQLYNSIANGVFNKTTFGYQVQNQLDKIYCEENNQQVKNLFSDKIKRIQNQGLYSIISSYHKHTF